MKYRIVPEERLLELLSTENKMVALESGGVDNWEWYGASICDYINEWVAENNLDLDKDWSFEDIARKDIEKFFACKN